MINIIVSGWKGELGRPGPSQFLATKKVCFSQSRFLSVVLDAVPGPARHTWWCPCTSEVSEAIHEASSGPLKDSVSAQKALPWRRRGSCWEERKRKVFPRQGVIDLPGGHFFWNFYLSGPLLFDCLQRPLLINWLLLAMFLLQWTLVLVVPPFGRPCHLRTSSSRSVGTWLRRCRRPPPPPAPHLLQLQRQIRPRQPQCQYRTPSLTPTGQVSCVYKSRPSTDWAFQAFFAPMYMPPSATNT